MAVVRALVTIRTSDLNPANFVTNSFWFDDDDDIATNGPLIATALTAFYNSCRPYMSGLLAAGGHTYEFYRESDPQPRVPVYAATWTFGSAPSGVALPAEVALCASFQAERISGLPQNRRRGRVYVGTLNTSANTDGRPASAFRTAVVNAANGLEDASNAAAWTWVVFSRVNVSAAPVTDGWVDDAFDTQRRRGVEWTARTTWS